MIYKQRSSCTFEGEHLSTRRLVDRIKTEATLWARAGAALPLGNLVCSLISVTHAVIRLLGGLYP
jgi:hypothetical protein